MSPFSFHVVRSEAELCKARSLREAVYSSRLGVSLSETLDEAERDKLGYVFLLERSGEPVGTARVLPTTCEVVELRRFGWLPDDAAVDESCAEVSRIATLRSAGSGGVSTSLALIGWSARWILRYSSLRHYVAYNRLALLPLWKRLGAADTGTRFVIAERGSFQYAVISGAFCDVASKTAAIDDDSVEQMLSLA